MRIIRQMRIDDIPLGLELCRLADWNQVEADWARLIALEPSGVFAVEEDGRVCGTASAICHGRDIAWIGMVLVHPDFRGKGIGSGLMARCIDYLHGKGVRAIKLDATDQGRGVYLKLGFVDEQPIWRMAAENRPLAASSSPLSARVRAMVEGDWPGIAALDHEAFGADRTTLLRSLAQARPIRVVERDGRVAAFGLWRPGEVASFLGPAVAADATAGEAIVHSLLRQMPPGRAYWDILPNNSAAVQLAKRLGFVEHRKLTRMCLGDAGAVTRQQVEAWPVALD